MREDPGVPEPRTRRVAGLISGVTLVAAGLAAMAAIVLAAYGHSAASWTWSYRLGLPGSLIASAFAQILLLTGCWLLWRSLRRGP